ncbi:MAG TPA: hypothetical protein VNT51_01290, partial [Miltoncostaeaceae bacterium]|nr:hypothetical protein [Miltoncostaeaceae bacterium]
MGDADRSRAGAGGPAGTAATGSPAAAHCAALLALCHRVTDDRDEAAEIVEAAFAAVLGRPDAHDGRPLAIRLRRAARVLLYERAARRRLLPEEGGPAARRGRAARGARRRALARANRALPARHRMVLALHELDGAGDAE